MGKKQEPMPLIGEKAYEEALLKTQKRSNKKVRSIFTKGKEQKERIMEQNSTICWLEFELEKANKRIDGLVTENSRLLDENSELRRLNSALEDQAVDYQKTMSETTATLTMMQEYNAQLLADYKECIALVQESSSPIETMVTGDRAKLAKLQEQVDQWVEDMQDSHDSQSHTVDVDSYNALSRLREDHIRALTNIDVLEIDLQQYRDMVMNQREEIATLNVLIEGKEQDLNSSGIFINQLNQLLETVQEENVHLQHKLARTKTMDH